MAESEKSPEANLKHQYKSMDLVALKALLDDSGVTKNQKKKIKKQIEWLENAQSRRHRRKERKKEKAAKKRQLFQEYEKGEDVELPPKPKKPRKDKISTKLDFSKHVHVAIDLSFDEYMTNHDLSKLRKQLGWCYQENRRCERPVQVHFDSPIYDQFKKDDIVYLTSESSDVLENVESGKVYIIGGLVDHNKHKGLTHKMALENGVETKRLPLEKYVDMKTRKVLTVNHVFNIITAYCSTQDWKTALLMAIPVRKGALPLQPDSKP